jgi:hypothetical protein
MRTTLLLATTHFRPTATSYGREGGRKDVPNLSTRKRHEDNAVAGEHPLQAGGDVVPFDGDEVAVLELLGLADGGFEKGGPVGEAVVWDQQIID